MVDFRLEDNSPLLLTRSLVLYSIPHLARPEAFITQKQQINSWVFIKTNEYFYFNFISISFFTFDNSLKSTPCLELLTTTINKYLRIDVCKLF